MSVLEPARRPAGVPIGGEFAPRVGHTTGVALSNLSTGTYMYPPSFVGKSADDVIAFYESVEVEDDILANIENNYQFRREGVITEASGIAQDEYKRTVYDPRVRTPQRPMGRKGDEWDAACRAYDQGLSDAWDKTYAAWSDGWEPKIHPARVRGVAIAYQMWRAAYSLEDVERDRVLGHVITISGRSMTIQQVADAYRLDKMDSITRTRLSDSKMDQLASAIRELGEMGRR